MTVKQKRFCDEYLIDNNATQAAIRAGYSEKTAAATGARLLINVNIKTYIDEQLARIHSEKTADAREVMEYLTSVMRGEQSDHMVINGPNGPAVIEIPAQARDRIKAAELVGKRYGTFKDGLSVDGGMQVLIVDDLKE